jgi:chloramphenicol 3-O-phosphotransferase
MCSVDDSGAGRSSAPARPTSLDLDPAGRDAVLDRLHRAVAAHFDGVADLPVVPAGDAVEGAVARVRAIDLEHGTDPVEVVGAIESILQDGIVHTGHPGYLGLFNPAPTFMGVIGDALAAAFNPQLAVRSHAPAAVEIESACTELLIGRLGLPPGSVGQFTCGGSEANLLGLLAGLHRTFRSVAVDGVHGLPRRPLLYASTEAHHSTAKLARAIGLGASAMRSIPVDRDHRLDVGALARTITADRAAGSAPFLVVATAGTTSSGAIDPLAAVAALTAEQHLHLHVDAAWAGAVALSDRHRHLLDGIAAADSVTIDAHKWLSAPMGAGVLLTPHAAALRRAFAVDAGYMPSGDVVDPYLSGLQWSRRFTGLKVFLALAAAGREGVAAQIDRGHHRVAPPPARRRQVGRPRHELSPSHWPTGGAPPGGSPERREPVGPPSAAARMPSRSQQSPRSNVLSLGCSESDRASSRVTGRSRAAPNAASLSSRRNSGCGSARRGASWAANPNV